MNKVYEFRRLVATDVFLMTRILSKIGLNKFSGCFKSEEVQKLINNTKEDEDRTLTVGAGIFLEVLQVVMESLDKCEADIYNLLATTSNLTVDEVKALDCVIFFEMLQDFIKKEEFLDFFKAASRLLKKEN